MSETRALLDAFKRARAVTLTQLIEQFMTPGIPDGAAADAKQSIPDHKGSAAKPSLSRSDAFSQLLYRFRTKITDRYNDPELIALVKRINSKWGLTRNSYEKIILGLAYWFGFGGLDRNKEVAFDLFNSALGKTESDGYALTLIGFAYPYKPNPSNSLAYTFLDKAIAAAPTTTGFAHTVKSLLYKHTGDASAEELNNEYQKAAELNDIEGLLSYAQLLMTHGAHKLAQAKEHLKAAIVRGSATALAAFASSLDKKKQLSEKIECHMVLLQDQPTDVGYFNVACYYERMEHINVAAAYFRGALAMPQKDTVQLNARKALLKYVNSHQEVRPGVIQIIDFDVLYHYGMACGDDKQLYGILKDSPETFIRLWEEDHNKPLHPKMKRQAIQFVLKLNARELSLKANDLLAKAFYAHIDPALKAKSIEFSTAQMDALSVPALAALAAIKASPVKPNPVAIVDTDKPSPRAASNG